MENIRLEIIKYQVPTIYHLEDYCTSIKLSNSFSQIASELNFEIPCATLSSSLLAFNLEIGDKVWLYYNDNQIFGGKVTDINLKGKEETLAVTCYDFCWWLVKSNVTKNFNNISVYSALDQIYKDLGATYYIDDELGSNSNIIINNHLVKAKPASKVLYAIYNEVTKVTGSWYYMHTLGDGATVTITEADKYYSGLTIQAPTSLNSPADGNLIDYEINESMQNMITRVEFHKTDGAVYDTIGQGGTISLTDENMGKYGVIQEIIEVSDDDTNATKAQAEGNQKLSIQGKPSEELTVTCFGDIGYQVAHGVMVKIPNTNYYDKFMYIVSSEWIWNKDETFITKLTLSTSKNQNLTDWTSVEEKQESTSSKISNGETSSDLVNRIIAELKKHLGLAYKWAGKSPSDGGMDCSGYISYVYNQFSDELDINSNSGKLTSYTVTMMEEGKDVTSDFPDNLKECDIIFPHSQHVVAYIGDGQIIEEPRTGDVCKIGPIRWNSVAKVIRVVPDSAWTTTSSSNSSTSDGNVSDNLVEFVKGWEAFYANVYDDGYGNLTIGYGTTAKDKVALGSCTESEATQWLKDELNNCATSVKSKLDSIGISLPQNRFDTLCDMAYNMGSAGFNGFYDLLSNKASDSEIKNKLMNYNHAGGSVSAGLTKRCNARVKMWFDGVYDSTH